MPDRRNLLAAWLLPLVYLAGCALLAALLAYPAYRLVGTTDVSTLRTLVSRGGQALLIAGLYPLWRWLRPPPGSFGLDRTWPRQALVGFGLGAAMLGAHCVALMALEIRSPKPEGWPALPRLGAILATALGSGLAVAALEETLFRGAMLGLIRHRAGAATAILATAAYYAALHFLGSHWEEPAERVGLGTAFRIVADAFSRLPLMPLDSFIGLFVAGIFLASVRVIVPRGLGYCYGLHAGWVFVIKTAKALTQPLPDARWAGLVGSYDRFVGTLSASWLIVLTGLLWGLVLARARRCADTVR